MEIGRETIAAGLGRARYLTTPAVETVLYLALTLERPLLIEGPAGAGKTEIGKVLAETLHAELIRLQCYEGLDEAKSLYEWNYQKQLLRIQADRDQGLSSDEVTQHVFSREYLLDRPLLRAITTPRRVVLLIDDRQGGRGVRGVSPRAGVRVPGHDPRARHDPPQHRPAWC
jgi:MoxR-like ATPase